jgi:hypothetical protein
MPRCVLNEKCFFPDLTLREGHLCPICLGSVHVLCGVKDPECMDLHLNATCNACASLVPVPLQAAMTTQAMTTEATTYTRSESPKEKMKDKEPPKKKTPQEKDLYSQTQEAPSSSRASSNQAEEVSRCAVISACSGNRDSGSAYHEECLFSYR